MKRCLYGLTALVAVIAAGVVHGVWTDRWGAPVEPSVMAGRLSQVPLVLGEWVGQDLDLDWDQLGPVTGSLYRRYVNQRTASTVTVFLVCGRPGPVAIHSPDVCYRAGGYELLALEKYSLPSATASGEFFTSLLRRTRASEQHQLRIFWSWYAGGSWSVPHNPRLAFARHGALCKLYLLHEIGGTGIGETGETPVPADPCVELMSRLLPELQKSVFNSQ
jgi:hypothetical protein